MSLSTPPISHATPHLTRIEQHTFIDSLLSPGCTVVDIGANKGHFWEELRDRYNPRFISVEPTPVLAQSLRDRGHPHVVEAAVSHERGTTTFYLEGNNESSSLLDVNRSAGATPISVRLVTLADVLEFAGPSARIDLLKIDIEGAEVSVLSTVDSSVLGNVAQLTVEYHDTMYPEQTPKIREIDRRLASFGFLRVRMSLRHKGDVLYINPSLFPFKASRLLRSCDAFRFKRWFRESVRRITGPAR